MNGNTGRAWRGALAGAGMAMAAAAQVSTNHWGPGGGGDWNTGANWTNPVPPDGAGQYVHLTGRTNHTDGFTANSIITLDQGNTVGYLIWGDRNRNNQLDLRGAGTLGFDTGDSRMALLSHGSGDMNLDIGNGGDDTDVGIGVYDSEGLYFDTWQTFTLYGGTTNSRALDGGGRGLVKAEDGTLVFQRIVTNVSTLLIRDGRAQWNLEGDLAMLPDITNIVIGVAPGVVDTGTAHPLRTVAHPNEGSVNDRVQFPNLYMIGINNTNNPAQAMTNAFDLVMNRGAFITFARRIVNGTPGVFSGDVTLNGSADEVMFYNEVQDAGNLTSSVRQTVFTGAFTGDGGFTKRGTGEMTLTGTNDFQGVMNLNREFDRGRGRYGSVGLREGGQITGMEGLNLIRNGSLYLDNSAVNMDDRVRDGAWITSRGRNRIEILGNAAAASSETLGAVTNHYGALYIELDMDDATPQSQTLNLANLVRSRGSVVTFHASDTRQGVWTTNAGPRLTVNLLDGGASVAQVGSGGAAGAVNRSVAVGIFGGDGSDLASVDPVNIVANRADEFMTVDGGGRLRTLDMQTEVVHLGGRLTNALTITQASAPVDANVNIAFRATTLDLDANIGGGLVSPELINKRVTGSPTFNTIRFGLASNLTGAAANDSGRSLLLDNGSRLTSESGMLLLGRDTGSDTGESRPGGSVFLYRGILDLDGTANDREAIVHNASGDNFYIRSVVEASQGFTKSGENGIVLEAANRFGGDVNIANGTLYLRNHQALGGATQAVVSGSGYVALQWGIAITGVTFRATELPYGKQLLASETHHNVWGGDILLQNYDPQGFIDHEPRIGAGINSQNATLTVLGDIGIADDDTPSPDVSLFDALRLSTSESAGILNLYGNFGDRIVGGEALPFDPALRGQSRVEGGGFSSNRASSENDVLRFRIDGPSLSSGGDELAVHIANPWRATGRIYAEQGTIRFLGDPGEGKGEFWDARALTNANFANGQSGFQLAGPGTDARGSVTLLLTRDGQVFNAERWTVATDNSSDNTATIGLEHFGADNATVTIGNTFNDPNAAGDDNRITFDRELRVYSHNGWNSSAGMASVGRVNIVQSLRGNGNSTLTKTGDGVVVLQGPNHTSYDESNDISRFILLGGELVLDRSPGSSADLGLRRSRDAGAALVLAGGDLTHVGTSTHTSEVLSSNVLVRAGDSTIRSRTTGGGTNTLFLATLAGQSVTRRQGGTVNFEKDLAAGGNAGILLGHTASSRIGSWAVFSSNGLAGASWAATDAGMNVTPFTGFSVDTYGPGLHSDVTVNPGFGSDQQTASLRFDAAAWMGLGGFQMDVTDGGILVGANASDGLGGASSIDVGTLTSSGGELIVQNYNPTVGFIIGAAIQGPVALTHSGPGRTTLVGPNTFDGIVYINGGTVAIDSASRLGAATNTVELRGGALEMNGSMDLGNRRITLGGDGGTLRVAPGSTVTYSGQLVAEDNLLSAARQNNGVGDLVKEGAGRLVLTGANTASNTYQGLTDIRSGTLTIARSNAFVLGSSHSFYDGTVVRSGATFELAVGGVNNNALDLREWLVLEQGATLKVVETNSAYIGWKWNAPVDVQGDATIDVNADELILQPDGAGYLTGVGSLSKIGNGLLMIAGHSPEFTGGLAVYDGRLQLHCNGNNPVQNAGTVTIGMNDTTDRGEVAFQVRSERGDVSDVIDVPQPIVVQGNSSGTRLGIFRPDHNDVVNFTGSIDLTNFDTGANLRELQLWTQEDARSYRKAVGADEWREEYYVNYLGDISGGNKRLRTVIQQDGNPNRQDDGAQLTNEVDLITYYRLGGTNTWWTGSLEVGNRTGTSAGTGGPDFDKQHYMRFGNHDGVATLAISSNNVVVLRNNAHLQAFGSQVTIGTLMSDGKADNTTSDYYGNDPVADTWLENGGLLPGSFRIVQHTNRVFQGVIRDGTYRAADADPTPAAALSILKDGPATLTLDQVNAYSGTTRIMAGTLALTGSASIANSPVVRIDAGAQLDVTGLGGGEMTLAAGQTLMGEGTFSGGLIVASGATNAPGSSPGVLTATGDVEFQSGSVFSVEIVGTLAGEADQLLMSGTGDTLTLGGATLSLVTPNVLPVSSSFVIIDGFTSLVGTFDGLPGDGDTVATANNTFEIFYNDNDITLTVVPEPGSLGFVGLATLLGWLARRRRC